MQCEICGKEAAHTATIELDGIELTVCGECAGFGVRKEESVEHGSGSLWGQGQQKQNAHFAHKVRQPAVPSSAEMEQSAPELAENLGAIVSRARERKGLTIKELSEKVFEKESVLHKIEQGRFSPDARLRTRLEAFLGIGLGQGEKEGGLKSGDLLRR